MGCSDLAGDFIGEDPSSPTGIAGAQHKYNKHIKINIDYDSHIYNTFPIWSSLLVHEVPQTLVSFSKKYKFKNW